MNKLLTLAFAVLLLSSCEKNPVCEEPIEPAHPSMRYTDLQNFEVKYGTTKRVDVDGDGTIDYSFETLLVGDALGQRDRLQFYADSKIETYQPVNESEQVPQLSAGDPVKVQYPGYTWYEITAIVLAEKITPVNGTPYWDGPWKAAAHKYLPIMIRKGGQRYYGWIELSFDTAAEKMILHRAAIAAVAEKEVKAGY
jgi:hypothetical protein